MRRALARTIVGLGLTAATWSMLPPSASAHVGIDTFGDVEQGSFAKLGFSVPNERDDANTVKLRVQMPEDHPLPFVSVQPISGWTIETEMRTLDTPIEMFGTTYDEVVGTITWTAEGDTQIRPGEFELFWISAGAMPTDATSLAFPAIQTYSSGEEVAWIDPVTEGAEEPDHPTPIVSLIAAGGDAAEAAADDASASDEDGTTLAMAALIVGGVALVVGAGSFLTGRRRPV